MRNRKIRVVTQRSEDDDCNLYKPVEDDDLLTSNLHILKLLQSKAADERFINKFKHVLYLVVVLTASKLLENINAQFPVQFITRFISSPGEKGYTITHSLFTALFIFYACLAFLSSRMNCAIGFRLRRMIGAKLFWVKTLLFLCLIFLCGFVYQGNEYFASYLALQNYLFYIGSAVYMFVMSVIVIDMLYKWNGHWIEDENAVHEFLLILFTGVFVLMSLFLLILLFIVYCNTSPSYLAVIFTVFAALVYLPLSIYVEHGSLFVSAAIMLYTSFLCYTTLARLVHSPAIIEMLLTQRISGQDLQSADSYLFSLSAFDAWLQYLSSFFFGILFLSYCCLFMDDHFVNLVAIMKGETTTDEEEEYEHSDTSHNYTYFHIFMTLATCFAYTSRFGDTTGHIGYITKLGMLFITVLLYSWSLLAPSILNADGF